MCREADEERRRADRIERQRIEENTKSVQVVIELQSCIRRMIEAIPGGSVCDPQEIADMQRNIAISAGVEV